MAAFNVFFFFLLSCVIKVVDAKWFEVVSAHDNLFNSKVRKIGIESYSNDLFTLKKIACCT